MSNYTKGSLPTGLQKHNAKVAKSRFAKYPNWVFNDKIRARNLEVYDAYIRRTPVAIIMQRHGLSYRTVWEAINQARELAASSFQEDLAAVVYEQVEARKRIIEEARRAIDLLMPRVVDIEVPDPDAPALAFEGSSAFGRRPTKTQQVQAPMDARAGKSIAELLDVISKNEQAIEELMRLRDGRGRVAPAFDSLPSADDGESPQPGRPVIIVDVRAGDRPPDDFTPARIDGGRIVVMQDAH